jgi:hypothetical protein
MDAVIHNAGIYRASSRCSTPEGHAGILAVNNRVHAADRIDLLCNALDLGCAAQVTDYDPGGLGCEFGKRQGALGRSCVKEDLMAIIE